MFESPDAEASPPEGGADVSPPLDAGAVDATSTPDASSDGPPDVTSADATSADVTPIDAAPDVPVDAIVEAFCDVTWPITKAGRSACGPIDECEGQPIPWCLGPDGQGGCKIYLLECVGAKWQCMGGVTPTHDPGTSCQ